MMAVTRSVECPHLVKCNGFCCLCVSFWIGRSSPPVHNSTMYLAVGCEVHTHVVLKLTSHAWHWWTRPEADIGTCLRKPGWKRPITLSALARFNMMYSVKYDIDFTKAFLPSKYNRVSRNARKCKFIEVYKGKYGLCRADFHKVHKLLADLSQNFTQIGKYV